MNKRVVILQHRLLHYRVDFFHKLKDKCDQSSIDLCLVHGGASLKERTRNDEGFIAWANRVNNTYFNVGKIDLLWQPLSIKLLDADLIILMQENRIISNYPLILMRKFLSGKLAFWGHGVNFQSRSPNGMREKLKRFLLNKVDWWFAYTEITSNILIKSGYPIENITCLNNAIDISGFKEYYDSISEIEIDEIRKKLGIPFGAKIGIFCGSLYKDKKLDLLIETCQLLRRKIDFHMLVLGSGPELNKLEECSANNNWMHVLGIQKGRDKALYYKLADIILNPGSLGLHILDSFGTGIPLVSTSNAMHGPEIAYIQNGVNGILTEDDAVYYSDSVLSLLCDDSFYKYVSNNALKCSNIYTIDNMVCNFFDGIQKALDIK